MAQLDKTFPTLDCAACILTPKMVDCGSEREDTDLFLLGGRSRQGLRRQLRRQDQARRRATSRKTSAPAAAPAPKSVRRRRFRTSSTSAWTTAARSTSRSLRRFRRSRPSTRTTARCSKPASAASAQRSAPRALSTTRQKDEFIEEKYGAIVVATGLQSHHAGSSSTNSLTRSRRTSSRPLSSSV